MKRIKSIFLVLLLLLTSFNLCSFTSSAATATGISVDKKYITIALGKKINVLPLIPNELAVDNKLNVNTTKGLIAKWDGNLYDAESKIVKGSAVEVTALKTGKQKLTISEEKTHTSVNVFFTVFDNREDNSKKTEVTGFSIDAPDITMKVGEKATISVFVPKKWAEESGEYFWKLPGDKNKKGAIFIGKNYNKKGAIYQPDDTLYLTPDKLQYSVDITITALSKGKKRFKLTDTFTKKSMMINVLVE